MVFVRVGVALLTILLIPLTLNAFGLVNLWTWSGSSTTSAASEQASGGPSDEIDEAPPRVVIEKTAHDLGTIDYSDDCSHKFIVRNDGDGPLKLGRGPTTCSCTMSDLPGKPIPPGSTAEVVVASKLDNKAGYFSHSATILTNDPKRDAIQLTISGVVKTCVGSDPLNLAFGGLKPGERRTASVCIYSQAWEETVIEDVASSLVAGDWSVEPASAERLEELDAKSGKVVSLKLADDIPVGKFAGWVEVTASPGAESDSSAAEGGQLQRRTVGIMISGEVHGPYSFYGGSVDANKILKLGPIIRGHAKTQRLSLKFHNMPAGLEIGEVRTVPEFLKASIKPYGDSTKKNGLYRVEVTVPADAKPCNYMGMRRGKVTIETNNSSLLPVELDVSFAVMD